MLVVWELRGGKDASAERVERAVGRGTWLETERSDLTRRNERVDMEEEQEAPPK